MSSVPLRKDRFVAWIHELQNLIVEGLEGQEKALGSSVRFERNLWSRPGGGGGDTRVLAGGKVFEKAGVNTSVVHGQLNDLMRERLKATTNDFFAAGISLVLHPQSPCVPTVHANFRYFEQPDRAWFGGGVDLTPYVWSVDDFTHFHSVLKSACDQRSKTTYKDFKQECDQYFYIPHRDERRGVGGIFFDYLSENLDQTESFVRACGNKFLESYLPIVERRRSEPFSERQKKFQLLRRGRYVEFNLCYDRGTLFGLQTKGNIESILMSLPPVVHYDYSPDLESSDDERQLMDVFRSPRSWVD